ncbi:MAG TPA: AAA family ATPase [Acidimicrobiia bacterium]|nr:AAA family ATPase [Acidimicrobiia bacterium]
MGVGVVLPVGEWPLVGRARELHLLEQQVGDPACRGVVIAGASGVGKTRLAQTALSHAEEQGFATASVLATRAAAGLPFGALASLLPPGDEPPAGAVDDWADVLRRSSVALLDRAGSRRLVLLVDSAHLLDDASATLMHQIAARNMAFLLVTVQSGVSAPDPIVALWKDNLLERLDLPALDSTTLVELLETVLGGGIDPGTAARITVRSEGNVLFLRELVIGALQSGALRAEDGVYRLVGPMAPSDRLAELVGSRLAGLDPVEREFLEVVSFGEPLGRAELGRFAHAAMADQLERKGLLTVGRAGRRLEIRLAHPVYGDVLRGGASALRTETIAGALADLVERAGARRREDVLRVATWRLDAGTSDPDLMLAAARIARVRNDFSLAKRLAQRAADGGAGFPARLFLAHLASLTGHGTEAETALCELAAEAGSDEERAAVAVIRMDNSAIFLGDIDHALDVAREAAAAVSAGTWRDALMARRGTLVLGTEGPRAAAEATEPLLERAQGGAFVWAALVAAYALGRLGRLDEAVEVAIQGRAAHLRLVEPLNRPPWTHTYFQCEALALAGRFHEAEMIALEQHAEALSEHSTEQQAYFAWHLGQAALERGHVGTAVRRLEEAIGVLRPLSRRQLIKGCLTHLALAHALAGRAEDAERIIDEYEGFGLGESWFYGVDPWLARAWAAVARGDLPNARRLFHETADRGEQIGDLTGAVTALHALARLGRPKEVADRMGTLASEVDGDLTRARVAHTESLRRSDPAGLEAAAGAFELMGADLLAAEAAADAAVTWRGEGETRRATAAERRAATVAGRCEGAVTPGLHSVQTRVYLTPGERDVAVLAARGRANKDIADELYLSVRTVENRLLRAYRKLGISSRSELASLLGQLSGDPFAG